MTSLDDLKAIAKLKIRLRAEAKAARARVSGRTAAAQGLVRQFERSPWNLLTVGSVIAGYWPIGSEIDCRPLLRRLRANGVCVVLPSVEKRKAPLVFRVWDGGTPSATDAVGMRVPGSDAAALAPDIILVPLLLIDRTGHRLGYGGGYYDRTIKALRQLSDVTALGLAFDAQLTDRLPVHDNDMALDGVITEKNWCRFGKE